jgi:inhibitor of KinA
VIKLEIVEKIDVNFAPLGDQILVLQFEEVLSIGNNQKVQRYANMIKDSKIDGLVEVITAMASIAIKYNPLHINFYQLKDKVQTLIQGESNHGELDSRTIIIPVVFNDHYGIDLAEISRTTLLSKEEIIQMLCFQKYYVYMIGFINGVPYIGNLDNRLALPRRSNPRVRLRKGSVAIANGMTNIYTLESPGGWHLVGWTPMELFDVHRDPPNLLSAGDFVKYEVISVDLAENWDESKQKEWDQKWNL